MQLQFNLQDILSTLKALKTHHSTSKIYMRDKSLFSKDMPSITVQKLCPLSLFLEKDIWYLQKNSHSSKHLLKLAINKVKESCSCSPNMAQFNLLDNCKLSLFVVQKSIIKIEFIQKLTL